MKRLVVVADNSLIVEAIRIGLEQSGEFNVLGHADTRAAALEQIQEFNPSVVLVDDMERSDATVDLIRAIKELAPAVAVIFLTFMMEPERLEAIFDAGAVAAISKGTHPGSLGTLIRETVDGHVLRIPADVIRPVERRPREPVGDGTDPGGAWTLTGREREVLQLVAAGSSNREIARQLWVTEQTVKFHLANVYRKLDVVNRTQASHFAHINGLVTRITLVAGS